MTEDTALGPGAEFDLIRALKDRWGPLARGLGDDAAVLSIPRGERLVVSTDAAVEGVHFRRDWLSLREIGYRAVTAALSDLAAMAATPAGVLVSLQLSPDAQLGALELADGIGDAVDAAGSVVVGGNVSRAGLLAITTTVVGSAYEPLARSGLHPGDLLYLTGALGGPAAALETLERGARPDAALRGRLARPSARLGEARWLAARGAVAAIDVSDGLAADAAHFAAASSVRLEIDVATVPVFPGATEEQALAGGEEYELLLGARAPLPEAEFRERFSLALTPIGRAVEGCPGGDVRLARGTGGARVATPAGYDHLSR